LGTRCPRRFRRAGSARLVGHPGGSPPRVRVAGRVRLRRRRLGQTARSGHGRCRRGSRALPASRPGLAGRPARPLGPSCSVSSPSGSRSQSSSRAPPAISSGSRWGGGGPQPGEPARLHASPRHAALTPDGRPFLTIVRPENIYR
jgi:hypothetical protein